MNSSTLDIIPPDALADAQVVADCVAAGRPIPDDVTRRVRERSRTATQAVFDRGGLLNVAVDLVRQTRDEA